ncbi:hypothetical protein Taro_012932, partial [Colocasia esculenta]|nr:hypothetical protein [Colocasia esculenta]
PQYITQLAPLDIQTYVEMVKKAQLLEDATNFTDRIKGKFMKKEMTSSPSPGKPTNGKKRPFNISEGPSQERKPKAVVPNTPAKSNCKHCDKPSHTTDECWRKVGACLRYGSREHRIPKNMFALTRQAYHEEKKVPFGSSWHDVKLELALELFEQMEEVDESS